MRELLRRHPVALFLAITYAVSWGAWLSLVAMHQHVGPGFSPLYLLGLLGPAIGAIVTTAAVTGSKGLRSLRRRMGRVRAGRQWLLAIGLPFGTYAIVYVVLVAYSMFLLAPIALPTRATLAELAGYPTTSLAGALVLLYVIGGLGEETGWRGFLQPVLQRVRSPLFASVLVAACWAPWHLPLFFTMSGYRAMPLAIVPVWLLGVVAFAILLGWLYNHGRRSIPLVAACHATFELFSTGAIAAVETTVIIVTAAYLVIRELRDSAASKRASLRLLPIVGATSPRRTS